MALWGSQGLADTINVYNSDGSVGIIQGDGESWNYSDSAGRVGVGQGNKDGATYRSNTGNTDCIGGNPMSKSAQPQKPYPTGSPGWKANGGAW